MLNVFKKIFKKKRVPEIFQSETVSQSQEIVYQIQSQEIKEYDDREIVKTKEAVLERVNAGRKIIICEDSYGIYSELSDELAAYNIVTINIGNETNIFNIFVLLKYENIDMFKDILSKDINPPSLQNVSKILLHSILLSMISTQELTWKKFYELILSSEREIPEYVRCAINDDIVKSFSIYKDMIKKPKSLLKQYERYGTEEYLNSSFPNIDLSKKTLIFYKPYNDVLFNNPMKELIKTIQNNLLN